VELAGAGVQPLDIDLGIAVGSRGQDAAVHSIDRRCQTGLAVAARKLGVIMAAWSTGRPWYIAIRNTWPAVVMRSTSRDLRTQPVPSMSAWADGSASTANTASGAASIVVDAGTRSASIPVGRLAGPELIAARDTGRSTRQSDHGGPDP
jgi:hypothetical protein